METTNEKNNDPLNLIDFASNAHTPLYPKKVCTIDSGECNYFSHILWYCFPTVCLLWMITVWLDLEHRVFAASPIKVKRRTESLASEHRVVRHRFAWFYRVWLNRHRYAVIWTATRDFPLNLVFCFEDHSQRPLLTIKDDGKTRQCVESTQIRVKLMSFMFVNKSKLCSRVLSQDYLQFYHKLWKTKQLER